MKDKKIKMWVVLAVCILSVTAIWFPVTAQEDETVYYDECSSCHFAYPPELLPETSWVKIVSGLSNHFGESIILLDDEERLVLDFLKSRSAENSSKKHSMRIMGSLGIKAPLRITEIPYIRKKHKDISSGIFERESVVSFSNCVACHIDAEDGIFSSADVSIPD